MVYDKKLYYEQNKEYLKEYQKDYRLRNLEYLTEYQKEYRLEKRILKITKKLIDEIFRNIYSTKYNNFRVFKTINKKMYNKTFKTLEEAFKFRNHLLTIELKLRKKDIQDED
tara:strand:- start:325 stop:660 length:336 start_codon:yes stop_codon:yes gene_type:complete